MISGHTLCGLGVWHIVTLNTFNSGCHLLQDCFGVITLVIIAIVIIIVVTSINPASTGAHRTNAIALSTVILLFAPTSFFILLPIAVVAVLVLNGLGL